MFDSLIKRYPWCFSPVVYGILAMTIIMAGCRITGQMESQLNSVQIPESEAEQDCLAWKTVLLLSLNTLIAQGMREELFEQRRNNPDHPDYRDFTKPFPPMDVTEVLSVKKARQLMDVIIEKEGGKCHKELLMDSQCVFNHRRGGVREASFYGKISYVRLNRVLGLSLHRSRLSEFDDFLKRYASFTGYEAQKTPNGFAHKFYCGKKSSECTSDITYNIYGSLGICLLKKHQKLLKSRNIFDLSGYGYHPDSSGVSFVEESLKQFIDRSNQLSQ